MSAIATRPVGQQVELGRYNISAGERVLYGQRINGVVRVSDHPAAGDGRRYLVERELEFDGNAALNALIADYLDQAEQLDEIPMATSILADYLRELAS
jgi:hypothetical protein